MDIDLIGTYPTCKHLESWPVKDDLSEMNLLMLDIVDKRNTSGERLEYLKKLIGPLNMSQCRKFTAWCLKLDQCCVLTTSVIIGWETPLTELLSNKDRLEQCDTRKCDRSKFSLCEWAFRHVNPIRTKGNINF